MAADDGLLQDVLGGIAVLREAQAAEELFQHLFIAAGLFLQPEEVLLRFRLGQAAGQRIVEDDQVVDVAHQHTEALAGDDVLILILLGLRLLHGHRGGLRQLLCHKVL